jgi:uncharacterized protein YceK
MKALTIILAIMLIIAGCQTVATKDSNSTHFSDTIQMHQSAKATREDVLRFVALQMPIDDAVRALEKQGFERIPVSKYFTGVVDPNWMIFEKCFGLGGWSTVEIRVLPENGKVKEVEAYSSPLAVF